MASKPEISTPSACDQVKQLPPASKRTVLLIDDDPAVLEGLRRVLCAERLEVIATTGGGDALEYIFRPEIDLVITDLRMAPIDGWDFLFHYRLERPSLPIFVVTGLSPHASGGAHRLATEYFQKPVDLATLLQAVRIHLNFSVSP